MPKGIYKRIIGVNCGFKHSEETKRKISIANTGKNHPMYGKHHSEEAKQKMSKTRSGKNNPNYGKHFSKKRREEMSKRMKGLFAGSKHPNWRGGKYIDSQNYIMIYQPQHPFPSHPAGYIYEHRLVMEKHLGRYLKSEEVVHHKGIKYPINSIENKQDNRIENLQLCKNNGEHNRFHNLSSISSIISCIWIIFCCLA